MINQIRKKENLLRLLFMIVMVIMLVPFFGMKKETQAAQAFEITAPANNGLIGAGCFDIKWSPAVGSSVKNYKLYIDGQLIATTSDTSYEYYTTNVKMYTAYVTAEYNNGTSKSTETITFGVTKKGLCANEEMARYLEPVEMNMGWYYNWAAYPHTYESYKTMEYVPMIWGTGNEGSISYVAENGYKHLLAYNEPDAGGDIGGSNIDVNTAIGHWNNFLGHDYVLGTPAPSLSPSWDNGVWFRTFMNGINHDTVDFIALHCYYWQYTGKEAAETFLREVVDKTYEMYHKPIWITEFAVYGWPHNEVEHIESVKEFMKTAIDGLNARPYVERYAWFSFNSTNETNGIASLYNYETGDLTELGRLYVEYGNPEGYVQLPLKGQEYTLFSGTRNTLLDDAVTIKDEIYENFVRKSGVSVVSTSDEGSDTGADKAIDSDIGTRWASAQKVDPSGLTIDLGQIINLKQINIIWETASAREYDIEVSSDGQTFTRIAEERDGISYNYKNDTMILDKMVNARYIRINGTSRNTEYGYSIWDIAVYGKSIDTKPEIITSDKVKIEGYQISAVKGGSRVIGSVEPQINNARVLKWGFIYALDSSEGQNFNVDDRDIRIDSDNEYVRVFETSDQGNSNAVLGESSTAMYFVRTMLFASTTEKEFTTKYKVRAYAQLQNGEYVYSNVCTFSVYNISDYLYRNKKMSNLLSHEYLYNNILKVVNPSYKKVDFEWSNILAK